MKKILLSLVAVLFAVAASAQTVTFVAGTDVSPNSSAVDNDQISKDGITITVSNGVLGRTDNYRCYKNQTMTVQSTVGKIVEIRFTCTASGDAQYGPGCFTVADGSYTFEGNAGNWIGSAETVVFTAATNQVRMTKIEVTTSTGEGVFVSSPVITPATGTYYTAQEVKMTAGEGTTIKYTVNAGAEQTYSAPFTLSECGTYDITAYAQDAEGNKSAEAKSTITIAQAQEYTTIADLRAACTANSQNDAPTVTFKFTDLLVTGAKNQNVFVTDGTHSYLLYGTNAKSLAKGDKISGAVEGKLYKYNNLGELAVSDSYANVTVTSSGNAVEPTVASITDVIDGYATMEATYVKFESVTFLAEAVANKTIAISNEDGDEINLYDNYSAFTNYAFDTTKEYNVSCYVAKYKETVQCYIMDESDIQIITNLVTPQSAWSAEKESILVGATANAVFATNSDGAVSFTSSNEAVATISAEGVITGVGVGTCTITAETAETETYLLSKSVITITVTELMGGVETFENGGFENWVTDAQPAGWKSSTTASNANLEKSEDSHSGSYSVCVKNTTSNKRLASKEFALAPGWYTFQFYAKSATETAAEARPGYAPWDAEKDAMGSYAYGNYTAPLSQTEWTLVTYTFELKADTQINLVVMNPKSTDAQAYGDLLVDDADFHVATEEEIAAASITNIYNKVNDGVIYNVAGQRVGKDYKGIVIVNGKKVMK